MSHREQIGKASMAIHRIFLFALAGSILAVNTLVPSPAEVYPLRPIAMIIPFAVGGPAATIRRILADHLHAAFGQPVRVKNVIGVGGTIGVGHAAPVRPEAQTQPRDAQVWLTLGLDTGGSQCMPA